MANPTTTVALPLAAPDGTVRAWACGRCGAVRGPPDFDLDEAREAAEEHCRDRCIACGGGVAAVGYKVCEYCLERADRAIEVLAAISVISMAVATWEMAEAAVRAARRRDPAEVAAHGYQCTKCGAAGVKLWILTTWRAYNRCLDNQTLYCLRCAEDWYAENNGGARIDLSWEGLSSFGGLDTIERLVAAVPTEDGDTFWGYTAIPPDRFAWWNQLPIAARGPGAV